MPRRNNRRKIIPNEGKKQTEQTEQTEQTKQIEQTEQTEQTELNERNKGNKENKGNKGNKGNKQKITIPTTISVTDPEKEIPSVAQPSRNMHVDDSESSNESDFDDENNNDNDENNNENNNKNLPEIIDNILSNYLSYRDHDAHVTLNVAEAIFSLKESIDQTNKILSYMVHKNDKL